MKKESKVFNIDNKNIKLDILIIEEKDRKKLRRIFKLWLKLSNLLKGFGARGVNIPEGLTESLFCLEMGCARVLKAYNSVGSFDTINLKTFKRQQIKASSSEGPTSFGPKSFWDEDELYWLDFFKKDGEADGTYDIYKIPDEYVYAIKVNKAERLSDQQGQKRRPRIDFRKMIVEERKLKPIKSCKI